MTDRKRRDALRAALPKDDAHPLLYVSVEPALDDDAALWTRSRALDEFVPLASALRARATAGRGQLVLVVDPFDDPRGRQFCAVQLARLLAEGDARVLVVDADLGGGGFSEDEGEAEGFADLVHYGSSPMATVRPSKARGVERMGSGSFRPGPGVEVDFGGVRAALQQLRQDREWVIIAAPALDDAGRYSELLVHADGIVLAGPLGRAADDGDPVGELVHYLDGQALPLWGAVVFAEQLATVDRAVESALEAGSTWAEPIRASEAAESVAIADEPSSPVFRRALAAVAILLVGFVAWWGATQWSTPTDTVAAADEAAPTSAEPPTEFAATGSSLSSIPDSAVLPAAGDAALDSVDADAADGAEPVDLVETVNEDAGAGDATEEAARDAVAVDLPPVAEESADTEAPVAVARVFADEVSPEVAAGLARAPGGGYSLHLWSFKSESDALDALEPLRADGIGVRVVAVELEERGTWYRSVIGHFDRREQALAARAPIAARLDLQQVGVVRVPY